MSRLHSMLILTILWTCVSCQTSNRKVDASPTQVAATPAVVVIQPTQTPRTIDALDVSPTDSGTDRTLPPANTLAPPSPVPDANLNPLPTYPLIPAAVPDTAISVIGRSAGGRDLTVQRFGTGDRILLLVGGIHGGYEANTVTLMQQMIGYFTANPAEIPATTAVWIVPVANPDGLAYGEVPQGRFNANGVDLNRNWGCEWSPDAYWRDQHVNAGAQPMSEPETQALAALIQSSKPAVALFYHSAAGGIFAGSCDGDNGSAAMSAVLGDATGYSYGSVFSAYPVTGTASTWADGQGVASADVELLSHDDSEFERNLRGVLALLGWLAGQP